MTLIEEYFCGPKTFMFLKKSHLILEIYKYSTHANVNPEYIYILYNI